MKVRSPNQPGLPESSFPFGAPDASHVPSNHRIGSAAQAQAAKLADLTLEIAMQASEDNQLFGSVSTRNIAEALAKNGVELDHQRVVLEAPIKMLGEYEVTVKLHHDVTAVVKINVVRA